DLAFAMRLITEDMKNRLHTFRSLRNDFAHEGGPICFEDARCRDRIDKLIGEDKSPQTAPDDRMVLMGGQSVDRRQFVVRTAFVLAVAGLSGEMTFMRKSVANGAE